MTREMAKKILGEEATEEQITNLLNNYHNIEKTKNEEINNLKNQLNQYSDYDALKKQLDDINKANMTEQEKLEEKKKEIEQNLTQSRIIVNTAKAKEILAGLELDDDTIAMLVSDDADKTINNATKLKEKFDSMKDTVEKQTRENLMNADLKPSISNVNQGENDGHMDLERFMSLSASEQEKFIAEHPDEFEKF